MPIPSRRTRHLRQADLQTSHRPHHQATTTKHHVRHVVPNYKNCNNTTSSRTTTQASRATHEVAATSCTTRATKIHHMAPHASATTTRAPTRSFRNDKNDFHSHHMAPRPSATTTMAPTRSFRNEKNDFHSHHMVPHSNATTTMAHARSSREQARSPILSYGVSFTCYHQNGFLKKIKIHGRSPMPHVLRQRPLSLGMSQSPMQELQWPWTQVMGVDRKSVV